ncbi:MAG TPA: hypothetical protein VGX76_10965 [Pirellulales bacterium]|jgi:hypothetical protein|nr:hypothetical protein [Pirellulales bacterium]
MFHTRWQNLLLAGAVAAGGVGAVGRSNTGAAEGVALQNLYNGRYLDAGRESVELKSEVLGDRCKWEKVPLAGKNTVALRNVKNRKYLAMVRRPQPKGDDKFELLLKDRIEDGVVVKRKDGAFTMAFDCTKWLVIPRVENDEEIKGQFSLRSLAAHNNDKELTVADIFLELPPRESPEASKADLTAASGWIEKVEPPPPPPAPPPPAAGR